MWKSGKQIREKVDKRSKTYNHQGVIAETAEYKYANINDLVDNATKKKMPNCIS